MKRIALWLGLALAALLLFALSVPFWIDPNQFRPLLESSLTQAAGRQVKLGDLKLALLKGAVTAGDLSVGDDPAFSTAPFVRAKSLNIQIEIWPLIASRRLNVTGLTIDQPEVILLESPTGRWNFSSLGASGAKPAVSPSAPTPAPSKANLDLSVKLVKIANGRFSMGRTGTRVKPLVLEGVDLELHDFSQTSVFPFSLSAKVAGGGDIQLTGQAGPLGDAGSLLTPFQGNLKVVRLDVAGAGLLEYAPGISGLISFDGSAQSKGTTLDASGKLKAEKLKLAREGTPAHNAVELDFAVHHELDKLAGQLHRADIHIGKAVAHLTGTYARHGDSVALKMNFSAHEMPVQELADMLPAMGIVLPAGSSLQGGTATAAFTVDGPMESLVTAGTLSFDKAKLVGFDLGQKMSTIERLAGIKSTPDMEIETLSAKLRMGPEGILTEDLKLLVPSVGALTGGGSVNPARELDFKMAAAVHTGGVMALVSDKPIPFLVAGTCSQPVFRPDMRALAKQEVNAVKDTVKQEAGKAAGSLLKGLLGGGKKN